MTYRKIKCPTDKIKIKCPYSMEPKFIVVHNTANDASAYNEISYMHSNNKEVSFHLAIDDKEVIEGIDLNRNAWHAGDGGSGNGNRNSIAIEICYSKSGGERFNKAEDNAANYIATLLKKYKWDISKVTKHQDYSGKNCPHRTLDLGWNRFLEKVRSYLSSSGTEVVVNKRFINLPPEASSWRIYDLNVAPTKGNEKAFLNPKKYGGLSYEILNDNTGYTNVYTIQTDMFGKVNIFINPSSTGGSISEKPIYK